MSSIEPNSHLVSSAEWCVEWLAKPYRLSHSTCRELLSMQCHCRPTQLHTICKYRMVNCQPWTRVKDLQSLLVSLSPIKHYRQIVWIVEILRRHFPVQEMAIVWTIKSFLTGKIAFVASPKETRADIHGLMNIDSVCQRSKRKRRDELMLKSGFQFVVNMGSLFSTIVGRCDKTVRTFRQNWLFHANEYVERCKEQKQAISYVNGLIDIDKPTCVCSSSECSSVCTAFIFLLNRIKRSLYCFEMCV